MLAACLIVASVGRFPGLPVVSGGNPSMETTNAEECKRHDRRTDLRVRIPSCTSFSREAMSTINNVESQNQ